MPRNCIYFSLSLVLNAKKKEGALSEGLAPKNLEIQKKWWTPSSKNKWECRAFFPSRVILLGPWSHAIMRKVSLRAIVSMVFLSMITCCLWSPCMLSYLWHSPPTCLCVPFHSLCESCRYPPVDSRYLTYHRFDLISYFFSSFSLRPVRVIGEIEHNWQYYINKYVIIKGK